MAGRCTIKSIYIHLATGHGRLWIEGIEFVYEHYQPGVWHGMDDGFALAQHCLFTGGYPLTHTGV
jgi:hypothetical protein